MANINDARFNLYCGTYKVPTQLRLTSASNCTSLTAGRYYILKPDVDCHIHIGIGTADVAMTNGYPLGAHEEYWYACETNTVNVAGITGGATGYLYCQEKSTE